MPYLHCFSAPLVASARAPDVSLGTVHSFYYHNSQHIFSWLRLTHKQLTCCSGTPEPSVKTAKLPAVSISGQDKPCLSVCVTFETSASCKMKGTVLGSTNFVQFQTHVLQCVQKACLLLSANSSAFIPSPPTRLLSFHTAGHSTHISHKT